MSESLLLSQSQVWKMVGGGLVERQHLQTFTKDAVISIVIFLQTTQWLNLSLNFL